MERRTFLKQGAIVAAGFSILSSSTTFASVNEVVKLGYIGVGERGRDHIAEGLLRDDVEIVAICDTQEDSLKRCREQFTKAGKKLPKEFTGGIDAYKKLLERKDIQGVIIATPWQFHHPQAIDAIVVYLIENNYLNEERFACAFARGKHRIKNWGRTRIVNELKARNISEYSIKSALKEIDADEYISTFDELAEKQWQAIKEKNIYKKKKKFVDYFLRKGFESSMIYDKVSSLT
ncbi:MAG: hypothetical protein EOP45_22275 [Sphingobacteriaceae bacterium]|nr:MAG: hypothetical protein EOP45_22275 [Sphingobacteriaceae bacterium]